MVFSVVGIVIALAFYLPITLLAPLTSIVPVTTAYSAPIVQKPVIALPTYGASGIGAVGYDGLLASAGNTTPQPIASITKVITTLVVLQKKPLAVGQAGPSIRFTSTDQAILDGYRARNGEVYPIKVGGSMSEKDVLTVTLVASANNYARALADWAYGSEPKFLAAASAWLKKNGLNSTTLTDSTGLNPQNRSTPSDLVRLAKLALGNPTLTSIVSIKDATLPVVGHIKSTNSLLGTYGVTGMKTGTLDHYGSSLLFTSDYHVGGQTITLVGVVLDGPNHKAIDAQIRRLIVSVHKGFKNVQLTAAGQKFAAFSTAWGAKSTIVASKAAHVVIWAGTKIDSAIVVKPVTLGRKGTAVGTATFTVRGTVITVPLTLGASVKDPGAWWRLTNPGKLS